MKYKNLKCLGMGSSSRVLLIKYINSNNLYALKKISEEDCLQYDNEIKILLKLNHPNIIKIYKFYITNDSFNIVMQYASCGSLERLIKKKKNKNNNFDNDDLKIIILSISNGLKYLHNNNIIHCDIKPSNILLFGNKIIKISDFGVSKFSNTTLQNTTIGTPYYMAPEVYNGNGYNNTIDYWSLGIIIYELIVFEKPFNENNIYQLMMKIINVNYELIKVKYKFQILVDNLLKYNPNDRYNYENIKSFFNNLVILPKIKHKIKKTI